MATYRVQAPDGKILRIEGPEGASQADIMAQARKLYRPERPKKTSVLDKVGGALANAYRGTGVLDEATAGLQMVGNIVAGAEKINALSDIPRAYQNALAQQRGIEDDFMQSNPMAATAAQTAGLGGTLLIPGGAAGQMMTRAAAGASVGARAANIGMNALRGGVAAAPQAAAYGLVDRGTGQERLAASNQNALMGFVAGAAAPAVIGAVEARRQAAPRRVPQNVRALNREGVQMTPGQMRGGMAKAMEDRATSVPILGQSIERARQRGAETYTNAQINRGLSQVGEELPQGVTGNEAIRYAGDRFGQMYDEVVPTGGVRGDEEFAQAISSLEGDISTLQAPNRAQLETILQNRVLGRLQDNALDGPLYQRVQSELGTEARRFSASTDADQQAIGRVIEGVSDALEQAAMRQNPEFATRLGSINRGYAEQVLAEGAAAKAGAVEGVFTPAQFGQSVRAADRSVRRPGGGGRSFARGTALGQDLSAAGKDVLPSQIGNSGTADRTAAGAMFAVPPAVLAAGLVGGPAAAMATVAGPVAALGLAGLASRAYSPRAIEAANRALTARIAVEDRRIAMNELRQLAAEDSSVRELYEAVLSRIGRVEAALASGGASE